MSLDDAKKGMVGTPASVDFDASLAQFVLKELGFIGPALLIVGMPWWNKMTNDSRKFWFVAVSAKKAAPGLASSS